MKNTALLPVLGGAMVLALAACGGGTASDGGEGSEAATSTQPSVAAEAEGESASSASDGGCTTASVSGESNNAELQALATTTYDALSCGGATSLGDQLKAVNADPAFQQQVTDAGWVVNFGEAMGGVSLSIVDTAGMTTCQIVVLDDLNSKGLTCGNV